MNVLLCFLLDLFDLLVDWDDATPLFDEDDCPPLSVPATAEGRDCDLVVR